MIKFSCFHDYLADKPQLHPKYMQPAWFEQLKAGMLGEDKGKTARTCPGFVSLFRCAIVLPLWADMRLTRGVLQEVEGQAEPQFIPHPDGTWLHPSYVPDFFGLEYHHFEQVSPHFPGSYGMQILPKPVSPWCLEMDPGWSALVMPATLHNSRPLPWEPVPGTFNCDVWHQTHIPCRFTREPELESTIFAGTPFAYLLPFKRTEDPGELTVNLVTDRDEWRALYSCPDNHALEEHLVPNYGRTSN